MAPNPVSAGSAGGTVSLLGICILFGCIFFCCRCWRNFCEGWSRGRSTARATAAKKTGRKLNKAKQGRGIDVKHSVQNSTIPLEKPVAELHISAPPDYSTAHHYATAYTAETITDTAAEKGVHSPGSNAALTAVTEGGINSTSHTLTPPPPPSTVNEAPAHASRETVV